MNKQPIMKFKDEEELIKVCKYYQHKLFLDNWTIKFKFDTDITDDYGSECYGLTEANNANREAIISINNDSYKLGTELTKNPVELVVIHELLHIFYPMPTQFSETFEGAFYLNEKHKDIESMAKAILMIKYDLDFSWFKNY